MTLTNALLIACSAASLIAAALLVFLLLRRRRETRAEADAGQRIDAAVERLEGKVDGADVLRAEQLAPLATEVQTLAASVTNLALRVETLIAAPQTSAHDPVAFEHSILRASWKQFCANKELSAAFDTAAKDIAWDGPLTELGKIVPADLKATFDTIVGPCREHRMLIQRIGFIPRVVEGTFPKLEAPEDEARRTREFAGLLTPEIAPRLTFRFKNWLTDSFLSFADLYLQRYQQAQLEHRHDELERGMGLVRQLLRIAAVEPIEVTPGQTPFDSTRHIGRSTSNDPRFVDGVITGVVRNGFIEGGRQVIRQPEVVVNRMR